MFINYMLYTVFSNNQVIEKNKEKKGFIHF